MTAAWTYHNGTKHSWESIRATPQYGQRLGATGLTFFDDEVTQFFSPHAAGKSVMFLTAVGKPIKRRGGAPQ